MRWRNVSRRAIALALLLGASGAQTACYTRAAWQRSQRIVERGFDFDKRGPWILFSAPGSLLVAGGNLVVGPLIPTPIDPREPGQSWFHAYPGPLREPAQVAILCHREPGTWISRLRPIGGEWRAARFETWHFPACIEAPAGDYELQVEFFLRRSDEDRDGALTQQSESTQASFVAWSARAGGVDWLVPVLGAREPSQTLPPLRHVPGSRALGTQWWELEESEWSARIEPAGRWEGMDAELRDQRERWSRYEKRR